MRIERDVGEKSERSAGAAGGRTEGRNSKVAGESALECTQASTCRLRGSQRAWPPHDFLHLDDVEAPRRPHSPVTFASAFVYLARPRRINPRSDDLCLFLSPPFPLTFESSHGGERVRNAWEEERQRLANPRPSSSTGWLRCHSDRSRFVSGKASLFSPALLWRRASVPRR